MISASPTQPQALRYQYTVVDTPVHRGAFGIREAVASLCFAAKAELQAHKFGTD
jgi:hypothetical protein